MTRFYTFAVAMVLASAIGQPVRAQESSNSIKTEAPKEESGRRWTGDWKFKLGGEGFSENKDEGGAAHFAFHSRLDYRFNSILVGHFEPSADLYSGRIQERFNDDTYDSRIGLRSGYLSLKPLPYGEVRAGAISHDFLGLDILIARHRAFPGVQEILSSETLPVNVKVMAQQLIPTSYSMNAERSEKEVLPTFATQSVHVSYERPQFNIEAIGGHFAFANLPDKVAYQSGLRGNSVIGGQVIPGAKLAYGFDGLFWKTKACLCLDQSVQFEFRYSGVRNSRAPSDSADSQMVGGGPRFLYGDYELQTFYFRYFVESDSTVSRYTRSSLGNTNRIGDILDFQLNFKKQGFKINAEYVHAGTLANTPNQQTMTQFYLGVETEYAPF